ncbi:MAG: DUF3299 domain-containing protein [Microscillaceae bacterium]|nr:DUF3299 domain-containing protein [Microscillaceae bacterium]
MAVFSALALWLSLAPPSSGAIFTDPWAILLKVKYTYAQNAYIPQFDNAIKALDNQTVVLKGYMYPLEEAPRHEFFMLSYYPINICFFCGGAGPESVIEVSAAKPIPYSTKLIRVKGKLRLNYKDRERLFYILLGAEVQP